MRWTVRGVEPELAQAMSETAAEFGMTLGECLNQAIEDWLDGVDEDAEFGMQELTAATGPADIDLRFQEMQRLLAVLRGDLPDARVAAR